MDDEVTNSSDKDEPWDQALIDSVPIPPASREDHAIDPDDPFSII